MTIKTTCAHLDEVRQSLAAGQWPYAATPELRAHTETCTRCAQEILLTTHFQQARAGTVVAAQPGTPSLLWWRAQLRLRNAALTRAARPLAAAHVFALVIAVTAVVGIIASRWHNILDRAPSAQSAVNSLAAIRGDWGLAPLILGITLITTLGGLAVYLSTDRH